MNTQEESRTRAGDFFQDFQSAISNLRNAYGIFWIETGFLTVKCNGYLTTYVAGNLFSVHNQSLVVLKAGELSGFWVIYNATVYARFQFWYKDAAVAHFFYTSQQKVMSLDRQTIMRLNALGMTITNGIISNQPVDLVNSYAYSLLLQITTIFQDGTSLGKLVDEDFKNVMKLYSLIEHHFKTEHYLNFYTQKMGLSRKRLNQFTLRLFGKSLSQLLQEKLLSEAESMMMQGVPIKIITYSLGFCAQSHFSTFYRNNKGYSPREFRHRFLTNHLEHKSSC